MKTTINDVAKHAGVSIKTVSRVINNETSVRDHTREKVMVSVNELNYHPNLAARSLAGTKSYSIAYIYDNPNAYYIIDMQNGILNACKKHGFELLIHPCNAKEERIIDEITSMVKHTRIAGVMLTPPFSEMPLFVEQLAQLDVKIVRVLSGNTAPDNLTPCIMIDDKLASKTITEHLITNGHKRIGFLAGGAEHNSTKERLEGYKDALQQHNITIDKSLIVAGEYSFESGVEGAKTLIALTDKPTAIVSCNDEIAAGALFAARLLNIDIPEQLSITGFENSPFSRQTWPKLTTANQPNDKIAEDAANLLIAQIRNGDDRDIVKKYIPELIVRDSTTQIN
ncbi:LacI family transcriptional regulator [Pseudoalteromonas aliena]|uniref:LacI family transcriptional regulator n=1 Tax=Pseudoalteromonas aliena TaxID=247523 RepID=A0A1Q2GUD7_9GAMM|nr:LacI family DNA-binding transcriptional regulator [Pseudoalteromonas aliena]AQP98741.1 LacI family transcriptional regulator [Pseudoalteromonas aliena]